jgi:uncharacterized protein YjiS (DUF1127 family)
MPRCRIDYCAAHHHIPHVATGARPASVRRQPEPTMAFDFLRRYLENRRVYVRTLRELSSCSERELHDLGIERADIYRIAREAARG